MKVLLDEKQIAQILDTLSGNIVSDLGSPQSLAVIGIRSHGETLAHRMCEHFAKLLKVDIPCGTLDITLYRDDIHDPHGDVQPQVRSTEIDFDINDRFILLVDDVLYTGRTVRAALDALMDLGRPKAIRLAVLVDRGGHELPIRADYVGIQSEISEQERVLVQLKETDKTEQVTIE